MSERLLEVPQGSFRLHHYPEPEPNRFAWNAADTLVLEWVDRLGLEPATRIVVVNDSYGALGVALADYTTQSWSDSYLALSGLASNLERNEIPIHRVRPVPITSVPDGGIELVVIRIPKSLARLTDQLIRLRPLLAPGAVIVGSGMTKDIHNSTTRVFDEVIGPTKTSLAKRKARLIHAELSPDREPGDPPARMSFRLGDSLEVVSWPGVFSSGRLDRGAELLVQALGELEFRGSVVDLGCGNGAIGSWILANNPDASVHFTDESYSAVESARETLVASNIDPGRATYSVDDCGSRVAPGTSTSVVINPPFHGSSGQTSRVSSAMFAAAESALVPGGHVIVVGNRHLGYHARLRERFGNSRVLVSNKRFSVAIATKTT